MDTQHIRNFCILAHIDHGKSTLADRFLELTGTVEKRKMREQFLDMHPLEREKGITIKMQPVRMSYKLQATSYILNLIDTPGHVDFTYEVSRALAAVEGAILLVDATQGVQAQTLANLALAQHEKLALIPAINKIDLSSADILKTEEEISGLFDIPPHQIARVSGKVGTGVEELLAAVIGKIPPPRRDGADAPLKGLIFDSLYDPYQGVIAYIRIFSGSLKKSDRVWFCATGGEAEALEVGIFSPSRVPQDELSCGEIGYIATGLKDPEIVRVGDTITKFKTESLKFKVSGVEPLPGYQTPLPMVFASIFPENQDDFAILGESLKKLKLEDGALSFEPEESSVLGRGYRTGFLGMLHMEIVAERLRREYHLALIFSNPSVAFRVVKKPRGGGGGGASLIPEMVYTASKMPPQHDILSLEEPWVSVEVITPASFLGPLTTLIHERSGSMRETKTLSGDRLLIVFEAPLREIIVDFYDTLKSVTGGFASMSYQIADHRLADLVRLDILVAGERVPSFSEIIPRADSQRTGRTRVEKLKDLLPRQLFAVALQAEIDGRIIARETIPAMRKDVTGYLYGGDRTRKMKLWKKQQKGKERLKAAGRVEIPTDVFLKMMKRS